MQKNRPRRESGGLFSLLSVVLMLCTFGAGLGLGWYLFGGRDTAPAVAAPAKKEEPVAVAGPPAPGPEAQLTFYQTLPAGGRGVIGSGLNLKRMDPAQVAQQPAPRSAVPVAAKPAEPQQAGEKQQASEKQQKAGEKQQASAGFVVQLASYREKQEAEKAQARLIGKGVAAYVLESKVPDNGVWYRIRIGRHLTRAEAEELAGKAGKGAVVLTE